MTAQAEHLILKNGFYIKDVVILVNQGGLYQFTQGSGGQIWSMSSRYIEQVVEEQPQGIQELKPRDIQQYLAEMRRQEEELNTLTVKSIEEAAAIYAVNRKEPYLAISFAMPFPSLGHAYAGDWGRGAPFIIFEVLPIVVGLWPSDDYDFKNIQALILSLGLVLIKAIELHDAAMTAEDYNQRLKQRLRLEVLPQDQGVGMRLKLQF